MYTRLEPLVIVSKIIDTASNSLKFILRFLGLGHVRLAIIDLKTSQQPLSDEEGTIWCVVTGEFYDFERIREELQAQGCKFRTKGDSELLIHL